MLIFRLNYQSDDFRVSYFDATDGKIVALEQHLQFSSGRSKQNSLTNWTLGIVAAYWTDPPKGKHGCSRNCSGQSTLELFKTTAFNSMAATRSIQNS